MSDIGYFVLQQTACVPASLLQRIPRLSDWDEKAGLPRDALSSQGSTCSRHKEKETGNVALGKLRRGEAGDEIGETTQWNPTGESPVRSKLASRPVASVAIHRATGGCEAYTARKQAVKIQLRNRLSWRCRRHSLQAEGSIRDDRNREGRTGIAGVASSGHASKEIP